jgi:sulfide:quinone oxidoreductase
MSNVTVIGTGFAALTAVRALRALDRQLDLTLVGRRPVFGYWPSLIWVPSGKRTGPELEIDLRPFLSRMNVEFHEGDATGLENGGRLVTTENGAVGNDGLIIATGGRFIKKLPGIEHAIVPCAGVREAEQIRDRLQAMDGGTIAVGFASNPKEPSSMRGGPMFEFLFGIEQQLRDEGRRDRFKLIFFSPAEQPGQRLGSKAVVRLLDTMRERGIDTHLGHKMTRLEADKVVTEGGEFHADLILFMPGMTGAAWLDNTDLPRSPGGLVPADEYCRVAGPERVYVAGDSGSFPGPDWKPKQAHMADIQAQAAGANLVGELKGGVPHKTIKWELACIVDDGKKGMLVVRTEKRNLMLPPMRAMHWAKQRFEKAYLKKYR